MLKKKEDPERPGAAPVRPAAIAHAERTKIVDPWNFTPVIHIDGGEILPAELFAPVAHNQAILLCHMEFEFAGQTMPFVCHIWQGHERGELGASCANPIATCPARTMLLRRVM